MLLPCLETGYGTQATIIIMDLHKLEESPESCSTVSRKNDASYCLNNRLSILFLSRC